MAGLPEGGPEIPPSGRTLEDVLFDVKEKLLCYSVWLEYGQMEPGLDDTGTPREERQVAIYASPAGFVGGLRIVFQGTIPQVLAMDLFRKPRLWGNPPTRHDREAKPYVLRRGQFMYGTDDSVRDWPAKLKKRRATA